MSRRQKPAPPPIKSSAYRPAIERLNTALEENTRQADEFENTARIQALGPGHVRRSLGRRRDGHPCRP